jgi:LacI family transcriptional regulator
MAKKSSKVTMEQVAELAGVSKATVSRVLGGSSLIGDAVREQVQKVADDLGYVRRNQKRHALRSILTIKLVLPPVANRTSQLFFSLMDLIDGLREGLKPSSVNIIVETNGPDYQPFRHKKGGEADAFVFAFHRPGAEVLNEISEREVACVVLNRVVRGVRQVVSDHRHALGLIAEHLAERGVTGKCCFVGYQGIDDVLRARLQGFEVGCQRSGIAFDSELDLWVAPSPQEITLAEVQNWLSHGVTTFVGVNDVVGVILLQHLRGLGLRVPQDIRVTGCDRGPVRGITFPRLTTVDLSMFKLAEHAGQSLQMEIVERSEAERAMLVKGSLLVGETT